MSTFFKSLGKNMRIAYTVFLFVLSIVFVLLLFPKDRKFAYEFKKGSPWLHNDLIAPFDFPVYKTESEIQAERDSIKAQAVPFYMRDTTVVVDVKSYYENQLELYWEKNVIVGFNNDSSFFYRLNLGHNNLENLYSSAQETMSSLINEVYSKGLVQISDTVKNLSALRFYLLGGNIKEGLFTPSDFYTPTEAYNYVKVQLSIQLGANGNYLDSLSKRMVNKVFATNNFIPNIRFDERTTIADLSDRYNVISPNRGLVQKGELIILKGNIVDNSTYRILNSLKQEYEADTQSVNQIWLNIGIGLLIIALFAVYFIYLFLFHKDLLFSVQKISFIFIQILLFFGITYLITTHTTISIYLIPIAIIPIIIYTFFHFRIAFMTYILMIFVLGFFAPNSFQYLVMQFVAGLVALFTLRNIQRRSQLFISVLAVLVSYSIVFFGFSLIQQGDINGIGWEGFAWLGGNSLLLLSFFPLMYVYEKLFGFISDVTLLELSDTNHPALRALAEKAPGTFQHSMQVANLAESVIRKIGGNPLLARTGALYHDIGKTDIPQYFIENQGGRNPHDDLAYDESAAIIIRHVNKGVEIAKKYRLPAQIVDFIRTHHGKSVTKYFYNSYVNEHPDTPVDIAKFSYPGPNPMSRETAILMMADSIEAASRSLKQYTPEAISSLVDSIVTSQLNNNQFDEVDITFRDVSDAKRVFKEKLSNIYHTRIVYPELNKSVEK